MSPSWILFEVIFRIFVEVIVFWVEIEGISDYGHFKGIPDLAEVGVGGDADGVAVSDLKCDFVVVSDWVDLVDSVDGLFWVSNSTSDLFDFVDVV